MEWRQFLPGTVAAAREAGEVLLGFLGRVDVEHKGAVDLVTEADRASEALLVKRLGELLPGAAILAEEGSGKPGTSGLTWVVDPLDGTTNFAHEYPVFAVSIALLAEGERVLGVIHDPTREECFTAVRDGGARLGDAVLRVSRTEALQEALLVTGFPYDVRTTPRNNVPQFTAFLKRSRAVRRDGSAALDLAYVAAGRFDGFWEEGLAPWDMAAGALLVEEAGGRVTGYDAGPLDLSDAHIVATNGRIHDPMLGTLREVEAGAGLPPLSSRRRVRTP